MTNSLLSKCTGNLAFLFAGSPLQKNFLQKRFLANGCSNKQVGSHLLAQNSDEELQVFYPPRLESWDKFTFKSTNTLRKRKDVHRDGDWHSSVHVWFVDSDKNVLIQLRSSFKDTFPNLWDVSCAGHIEGFNSPLETVLRECEEEVGFRVDSRHFSDALKINEMTKIPLILSEEVLDEVSTSDHDVTIQRMLSKTSDFHKELLNEGSESKFKPGDKLWLAHIFASKSTGSANGIKYICRELQFIYVLKLARNLNECFKFGQFKASPGEVSSLSVVPYHEIETKLLMHDTSLVPRKKEYVVPLFNFFRLVESEVIV